MPTTVSSPTRRDALHAAGVAAHRPGVGLLEADGHAVGGGQHHFVARLGHDHVDQLVALAELDGDDAALAAAGCRLPAASSSPARGRVAITR